MTGSTIAGNRADLGGGIFNTGSITVGRGSTIGTVDADGTRDGNRAAIRGGGIHNVGMLNGHRKGRHRRRGTWSDGDGGGIAMSGRHRGDDASTAPGCPATAPLAGDGGGVSNGFQNRDWSVTLGGRLTVRDGTVIRGNTAAGPNDGAGLLRGGGGIAAFGGVTDVIGSTVEANVVDVPGSVYMFTGGGGILASGWAAAPTQLNVLGESSIRRNEVNGPSSHGGGLFVGSTTSLTFVESTIEENQALLGGGANVSGSSEFTGAIVRGNTARWTGGGMEIWGATVVLDDTDVAENRSHVGGGIRNLGGAVTLRNGTAVTGNEAAPLGAEGPHRRRRDRKRPDRRLPEPADDHEQHDLGEPRGQGRDS